MLAQNISLGEILVQKKQISQAQYDDAVRWQRLNPTMKIEDILTARGLVTEDSLLMAYAEALGQRFMQDDIIVRSPEILKLVPEVVAKKYKIMPVELRGNKLIIATSEPNNIGAVEDVKMVSKKDVGIILCTARNIESAIERYYTSAGAFFAADEPVTQKLSNVSAATAAKMSEIESRVDNTPVVKLINSLVQQAYMRRASDIHIEPFEEQVLVRMRIDGELVECMRLDISAHSAIVSRVKILSGINIAEKRIPQDGRFDFVADDLTVDLRVSTLPTIYGEKVNMRLLATGEAKSITLPELGMQPQHLAQFQKIIRAPNGIILVTGPTGSGKSTTLYAVLSEINQPNVNITTVEDPVEKQIFGVNQVQTNSKAGLTFASGLRSILRQDPDVVMIGEIRDAETGEIAIRAAITGHLVLSTLHTNDAISSIVRLIDLGIAPYMVSSAVNCVVAQRLVKRLCPDCKKKRMLTDEEKDLLGNPDFDEIYEPVGCPRCGNSGFKGRIAVYEIVELDHHIKRMIAQGSEIDEIKQYAKDKGVWFLADSVRAQLKAGVTSISEYYKLIYSI